jgi:hypothetical protein
MMEAARTSETSVDNYFTRQYIPEDNSELHLCFVWPNQDIRRAIITIVIGCQVLAAGETFMKLVHSAAGF